MFSKLKKLKVPELCNSRVPGNSVFSKIIVVMVILLLPLVYFVTLIGDTRSAEFEGNSLVNYNSPFSVSKSRKGKVYS